LLNGNDKDYYLKIGNMRRTIRKYIAVFLNGVKIALTYRVEVLLWSFIDSTPLIAMLVIWLSAFEGAATIASYTQSGLIAYYISGYVFQNLTGSHFEDYAIGEIVKGDIAAKFLKPFSLKKFLIIHELSWRVMILWAVVLPVVAATILLTDGLMPAIKPIHVLVLPIFLAVAYLLESLFSLAVVAVGFVFEEARSLMHLKWMLGWLFSGSMIPFEFMPGWLSNLARILPFKYRYYTPVQIYLGTISGLAVFYEMLSLVIWLLVLYWLIGLLWERNVKKFTAVGS
jgi:ABC-2 type transport system permease protein